MRRTGFKAIEAQYASSSTEFSIGNGVAPIRQIQQSEAISSYRLDRKATAPCTLPPRTIVPPSHPRRQPQVLNSAQVPSKSHVIPSQLGSFELQTEFELEFAPIKVAKWMSKSSGLKVVWADVQGPLVQGYFHVASEIFDDSGRPHTLEHLTFMGSEKYPYKGILDVVANRLIANGTNAETATDHTIYTCSTASQQGFLSLAPVYLNHIFFPLLTESAFVTEVYHMNGKGEDAGVVLSEMQGSATDPGDLMTLQQQRLLFSKDNAYRSETGGLVPNLRKLGIQEIRNYHDAIYVPQNVTMVVLGGAVAPFDLLCMLNREVEPTFVAAGLAKGPRPDEWFRPFVESSTAFNPPLLPRDVIKMVPYPSTDESEGQLSMVWIGPSANDYLTTTALKILGTYLTNSSISPLSKLLIELKDPWCTNVDWSASGGGDPQILSAALSSVPIHKLDALPSKFKECLISILKAGIDMNRMSTLINRWILDLQAMGEGLPYSYLSHSILADALLGPEDGSDLETALKELSRARTCAGWTSAKWGDLLNNYYLQQPCLTVVGRPSAALVKSLAQEQKAWVAGSVAKLGPTGLARLKKVEEDAVKANNQKIPDSLIRKWKIPPLRDINWPSSECAKSCGVAEQIRVSGTGRLQAYIDSEGDTRGIELPIYVHFSHIASRFLEVSILFSVPVKLAPGLRSLVPIYIDTFFDHPVVRADGTRLTKTQLLQALGRETLSYAIRAEGHTESLILGLKVTQENYGIALAWMKDLLWGSEFDAERVQIAVTKQIQDLPGQKEDAAGIASEGLESLKISQKSIYFASNFFARMKSLPLLKKRLDIEPKAVMAELNALRSALLDPRGMRAHVKGDILKLKRPSSTWLTHFEPLRDAGMVPLVQTKDVITPLGRNPSFKMMVHVVPGSESTFGTFAVQAPDSRDHPDYPALAIARQVLNAVEGHLWVAIRGPGLAYGANLNYDIGIGLLEFVLFKSPDLYEAWIAARALFESILSGKIPVTDLQVDAAKSSFAYNVASTQPTPSAAAGVSFYNQIVFGRPADDERIALARCENVTVAQVLAVIRKYVLPIFDPKASIGSTSTGPSKVLDIVKGFQGVGYAVERVVVV